jgi:hypothetical protein
MKPAPKKPTNPDTKKLGTGTAKFTKAQPVRIVKQGNVTNTHPLPSKK